MTTRDTAGDLLPQLGKLLESLPCDYAEARVSMGESTSIALSGDEVESISSGESRGGSLRVFNRGAWSFCSFSDLSEIPSRAESLLRRSARLAGTSPGLFRAKPVRVRYATNTVVPCVDVPFDEKYELIRRYNET